MAEVHSSIRTNVQRPAGFPNRVIRKGAELHARAGADFSSNRSAGLLRPVVLKEAIAHLMRPKNIAVGEVNSAALTGLTFGLVFSKTAVPDVGLRIHTGNAAALAFAADRLMKTLNAGSGIQRKGAVADVHFTFGQINAAAAAGLVFDKNTPFHRQLRQSSKHSTAI